MPDKKLTDNEIIDGFNHCLYNKNNSCDGCCFKGVVCDASLNGKIITLRMVAEVLNRLQAENEQSILNLTSLQNDLTDLQAENERLQNCIDEQDIEISRLYKRIDETKAEAHKEFAGNLEKAFQKTESQMPNNKIVEQTVQICRNAIRIALKELVGDA